MGPARYKPSAMPPCSAGIESAGCTSSRPRASETPRRSHGERPTTCHQSLSENSGPARLYFWTALIAVWLSSAFVSARAFACHDGSPLVLDLDGGSVETTSWLRPVAFDIDADLEVEHIAWTYWATEEALLWLDLNYNGVVDDGRELFGDATLLPTGEVAPHGFEALAVYDGVDYGGNEDGLITRHDLIWPFLRLWIDRNHDGTSQPEEIGALSDFDVIALSLTYRKDDEVDGHGNVHRYKGWFVLRERGPSRRWVVRALDDVFFRIAHPDE